MKCVDCMNFVTRIVDKDTMMEIPQVTLSLAKKVKRDGSCRVYYCKKGLGEKLVYLGYKFVEVEKCHMFDRVGD